jgi:N-acetylglutamate synthase-like GNAT family acetyltransferase
VSSKIKVEDSVRFATLGDLPYIEDLSKKESKAIGFIPKIAYEAAITGIKKGRRWSDVCNDRIWVCENNGDLVGFVLASFGNPLSKNKRGKIAQICIQSDARKITRGKMLLCEVIAYAASKGCHDFGCGCAEDLESNLFWQAMNWEKIGERRGISHRNTWKQTSDRIVNLYYYNNPDQLLLPTNTKMEVFPSEQ